MFTVLFIDNSYENFDHNIVDNSSIIFTKCFEQEFVDTFYIKGIKTIYLFKNFEELDQFGIDIDIIVTGTPLDSEMYKSFDGIVYNYKDQTVIYPESDKEGPSPVSITRLSNLLKHLEPTGIVRCNTESYENLSALIDKNRDISLVSVEEPQDKFQKTMQKEATKLQYAENRERYKQKMRQSSLSNKKSLQKDDNHAVGAPKDPKDPKGQNPENKTTKTVKTTKTTKTTKK